MYCRAQLGELRDEQQAIRDLNAQVLAISTDDLSRAQVVVERLGLTFPILYDPLAGVVRAYGVFDLLHDRLATPSTFIIDRQGRIRWSYVGQHIGDRATMAQIIEQLQHLQQS